MARNEEQILVRIINKVEGAEQLIKEENLVRKLQKSNGDLSKTYEEQTATQRKRATVTEKTNAQGEKTVDVNTEILAQGPRFQMHFLGIMFGGMALNRAMTNLTATSKEWVGVGEIMATTMGVVMLPATLELLDKAIIPLMNTLLGLPEETKLAIGLAVFGLEGLGKALEILGQIALFKLALPVAFPGLIPNLKKALTSQIGRGLVVAVGLTIAWQSVDFIRTGIEEGSLAKEILGVIGIGTGLGIAGLAIGGPVGGLLGFTLGISIGLIIDWFIKESNFKEKAKELGASEEFLAEHAFRQTFLGQFAATPTAEFTGIERQIDLALGREGGFQSFAVGGNVVNTGLHFLHEGETVLRKDQSGNQAGNISIVNNINVSDSRELERMIKVNNDTIIREVRRNAT